MDSWHRHILIKALYHGNFFYNGIIVFEVPISLQLPVCDNRGLVPD